MVKEENKKRFADGLETVFGDIGFFIGVSGLGSIEPGAKLRRYVPGKIESFYQRHEIPYTPRLYLRKK